MSVNTQPTSHCSVEGVDKELKVAFYDRIETLFAHKSFANLLSDAKKSEFLEKLWILAKQHYQTVAATNAEANSRRELIKFRKKQLDLIEKSYRKLDRQIGELLNNWHETSFVKREYFERKADEVSAHLRWCHRRILAPFLSLSHSDDESRLGNKLYLLFEEYE